MDIGVDRTLKMEQPGRRKRERPQTRCTEGSYVEQPLKAAVERRRSRRRTTKKEEDIII